MAASCVFVLLPGGGVDALLALIDDPQIDIDGLMEHIPGPDFPTAGIINGVGGIHLAYRTGRGRVRMRAKADIEVADNGREAIAVTEIPYQVNKARLIEKIAELVKEKKLEGISELRDVPDDLLNPTQQRVKAATLSGQAFFDQPATAQALAAHKLPGYFIDFETIQFGVPLWKGTRPYQQLPFQFSVHRLGRTGRATHQAFLDLSGGNPSLAFAQSLVAACGERGPVFVYNAAFETTRIRELAERHPRLATALRAINDRVVDLLPIARQHYYHPSQQGSWSIKAVLPALCPELHYDALDGVQDGGAAQQAYLEAITPATSAPRKAELERQLLAYCSLDTWAMVRLWSAFTGQPVRD